MQVITQLSVLLANRPGTLGLVCEALAKANINVHAICISETLDHSLIRIVVDKTHEALKLLESRGTLVLENEVLLIDAPHKIGSLEKIGEKLGQHGVNIEYVYGSCSPNAKVGTLVLRPSSIAKAMKAMNVRVKKKSGAKVTA